jgi:hypothetical protein
LGKNHIRARLTVGLKKHSCILENFDLTCKAC